MIVRKVFRLFAIRRLRRRRLALREQWNQDAGDALARTDLAGIRRHRRGNPPGALCRNSVVVPRTAEIPRPPADDRDSDHGIQALEAKESLQQLLYGGQRVAA